MNYPKIKKIKKIYFGYQDVARALGINLESAKVACARFIKQGTILRLKRNIYILEKQWQDRSVEDKFMLANFLQVPSYISLMTALAYYEVTTQVQRDFVESVAMHRTKTIEIEQSIFNYSKIKKSLYFGFSKEKGIFIATPEKAFLDTLYLMSLRRYSFDLTSIDFEKLKIGAIKEMLEKYPQRTRELWKKYGYAKKTRNI